MQYNIDFGMWGSIFAVPTSLIDEHIKLCSETQLKVLMIALRYAPNMIDIHLIAKSLGVTPLVVDDAMEYWMAVGVFRPSNEERVELVTTTAPAQSQRVSTTPAVTYPSAPVDTVEMVGTQKITTVHSRSKLTPSQINEISLTDPNVPWLLEAIQQIVARPLSPAESESLIYLYTYLQLTPDYMVMAMEYCKCISKCNLRYYEKLVTGWVDKGVDTHDKAEAYILKLSQRASNEGLMKVTFGIYDRELSAKEKNLINKWFDELHFDFDMIKLAYEKTVLNTGKVAFPYINKILSQWAEKGIRTVDMAQSEGGNITPVSLKSKDPVPSYDLDDIERIMELNLNR